MRGTKLIIVSNQHSFRIALHKAISECAELGCIEIVESDRVEVSNDTVAEIMMISPDIVLLDIGYTAFDGFNLAKRIVETSPRIRVILLSANPKKDNDELFEAAKSGASAYIIRGKQPTDAELIEAIKQVSRSERPIIAKIINNPRTALHILKRFHDMALISRNTKTVDFPHNIDLKELEVLQLVAKGYQRKQIAGALAVGKLAINQHVASILFKLNSNEVTLEIFTRVRANLLSVRLARDGNLFILNASPIPCQPQLLHDVTPRQ